MDLSAIADAFAEAEVDSTAEGVTASRPSEVDGTIERAALVSVDLRSTFWEIEHVDGPGLRSVVIGETPSGYVRTVEMRTDRSGPATLVLNTADGVAAVVLPPRQPT